jgi:hypothetical protein
MFCNIFRCATELHRLSTHMYVLQALQSYIAKLSLPTNA